jgi:hypothetical protein
LRDFFLRQDEVFPRRSCGGWIASALVSALLSPEQERVRNIK